MTVIVTNCRNGELIIRAPQCDLDKIVTGLEGTGVTVEKQPAKPTSIPQTVWNWGGQSAFARSVAQSAKKDADKPAPIPQSRIDFVALSKSQSERGLVTN